MEREIIAVKCEECGILHDKAARTFFSVHGNICIGANGGIIGNNIAENGELARFSVFCANNCFEKMVGKCMKAYIAENTHTR